MTMKNMAFSGEPNKKYSMLGFNIEKKNRVSSLTNISIIITVALAVLASSCSVNQSINLYVAGSGSMGLDITLKPVFVRYLLDLSEAVSETADRAKAEIFKLDEIQKTLLAKPGVKITKMTSQKQDSLYLDIDFASLRTLVSSVKKENTRDIFTLKETGGVREFAFHLDKKNYKQLADFFPLLKNPVFESLSPQEDEDISESDYLDIIMFALGDGGPDEVKSSGIQVKVTVDGTIVSQKGGKTNGNEVVFSIPLIKVLVLNTPVDYSVTYK
jgi:hypothetical protein